MADDIDAINYFKKLKRAIDSADFKFYKYTLINKGKVDDLFCCIIATLPDVFKTAMKKRLPINSFPSVASFNRLSKIIKKTFFLSNNMYIFETNAVIVLIQNILKNYEMDLRNLNNQ